MTRSHRNTSEIAQDVRVALGRDPVDLLLKNCQMINVYSNEIHAADLAISRGRVVAIRENFSGPTVRTIDLGGEFAAPAFIDGRFEAGTALREHDSVASLAGARHNLRNGRSAFLDQSLSAGDLVSILNALRREHLDTSALCFVGPYLENSNQIKAAVESGFSVPEAFQFGSLNPAMHFCVDDVVGSLAPGRRADILLFSDLENFRPTMILRNGEEVACS